MAFLEKVVPITVANTDTLIFEMPVGQNGSVHGLTAFAGATAATVTFKLFTSATGITNSITAKSVTANGEWTFPKPINMSPGDRLIATATAANVATIVAAIYTDQSQTLVTAFTPQGTWASTASYVLGDVVSYNSSSWIAMRPNTNDPPPSINWMLQAQALVGPQGIPGGKGDKGDKGDQGIQGIQGYAGGEAIFLDLGTPATGTVTMDYTTAQHFKVTVGSAITLAISNWPPAGRTGELMLELVNGAAFTVTWPTNVNWVKSTGEIVTGWTNYGVVLNASGTDFILLWSRDGGTTIYGTVLR